MTTPTRPLREHDYRRVSIYLHEADHAALLRLRARRSEATGRPVGLSTLVRELVAQRLGDIERAANAPRMGEHGEEVTP